MTQTAPLRSSLFAAVLFCLSSITAAHGSHEHADVHHDTIASKAHDADMTTVYASTNVWGAVAKAVGGEHIKVIAGVSKPDQDPHDYEASAHDKLDISHASLVIVNGGGYDDWASNLAKAVKPTPKILDAVTISGLKPADDEEFNEHVFYSLPAVKKVAHAIAEVLSKAEPEDKDIFASNEAAFAKKIDALSAEAAILGQGRTLKAIFTEPVVGYLLETMNIANITPEAFVEQSETEAGPSAKALLDTVTLLKSKQANLLVLNAQTEDDASAALEKAAEAVHTPIVKVYETFPNGVSTYPELIEKTIADFKKALQ